jgi:ribonuclease PH
MTERIDGRQPNQLRAVRITKNFTQMAESSILFEIGNTRVICTASIEDKVPPHCKGSGKGWVTAEYSMLPRATKDRTAREATRGKQTGRTQEIQRLIGRALRGVTDLSKLGERTIIIDCDVIQADGGTRVASITGGYIALYEAVSTLLAEGKLADNPLGSFLAAISVGVKDNVALLDLCYEEDSTCDTDLNVIMTESGHFIELQGTAEGMAFSREALEEMLDLAKNGIIDLIGQQKKALGIVEECR